jgi:hypothetical protein
VGLRAGLDTQVRRKILCPFRRSNPDRPVCSQDAILTELPRLLLYCFSTLNFTIFQLFTSSKIGCAAYLVAQGIQENTVLLSSNIHSSLHGNISEFLDCVRVKSLVLGILHILKVLTLLEVKVIYVAIPSARTQIKKEAKKKLKYKNRIMYRNSANVKHEMFCHTSNHWGCRNYK